MEFKISEKKKGGVTVVAIVLIVISLISIYITQCGGPRAPKIDIASCEVGGEILAEETAKILGNKGKIVVVTADTGKKAGPLDKLIQGQLQALQDTIKKQGNISIVATETISESMQRKFMGPGMPFPGDDAETPDQWLMGLVQKYPNTSVDAVVSLVGFPTLSDEEIAGLGSAIPKFIVLGANPMMVRKLLESRVISCAIVSRLRPPITPVAPSATITPREKFSRQYEILTPETLSMTEEADQPPVP